MRRRLVHRLPTRVRQHWKILAAFRDQGEKKWITADITIDGTLVTDAGVRLKGNSTLMGLRGTGGPGGGQRGMPAGMEPPAGRAMPEGEGAGGPGGMVTLSAEDPASLPLLISFDRYVSGRAYQGMTQLSVRPGSPVLNEAVSLSLTAESGQPTQRYAYTTYSVNGSPTQTRLVLEHPDEGYANSLFDSDGVLYKADANSSFTYQGDDQTTYADQFVQINAEGSQDLQPIITLLKWLDGASDEQFDAELADRVDVESFARYVATQNLLVNSDDMAGPGKNYYLWYDLGTRKISVVSWDFNLALSGNTDAGPHDSIGMGGGAAPGGGMPGGGGGGNALKERFLASEALASVYEDAYRELYRHLFGSGRAIEILDEIAQTVPASDGLGAEKLTSEVETLRARLQARTDALAANKVIVAG
ncbi:CotH kinase family protein [Rhodococcus sp. NPDC127530]|uniref:CotH kinase family protein n=1 Tax=unclassified Rhodococcus (in: high G+C Gram-positive bacteria) TaxID=192944 RepID=UPI003637CFDA